ncbi:MAG TPA: hypothetical protein VNG12_00845 [Acidimicrobiales bacterium]|nr:hypothetical protein [Acidimicrobiales bacterium]
MSDATDELRAILERNPTVLAVTHHVGQSGMQRKVDFYECPDKLRVTANPLRCRQNQRQTRPTPNNDEERG